MIEVFPVSTRTGRCYLVKENASWMMIDAGYQGSFSNIQKVFRQEKMDPGDLAIIVITHVHHDHVGSLARIKEISGAPVIVHSKEAITLERGEVPIPEGTMWLSRFMALLGRTSINRLLGYQPVRPDILIEEATSLHRFGFSGTIIPTPGHTGGSLSIVFGSGEAFVGDACIHLPWKQTLLPWFANDIPGLLRSWKTLLNSEATRFFPGHGTPFSRIKLEQSYRLLQKQFA